MGKPLKKFNGLVSQINSEFLNLKYDKRKGSKVEIATVKLTSIFGKRRSKPKLKAKVDYCGQSQQSKVNL